MLDRTHLRRLFFIAACCRCHDLRPQLRLSQAPSLVTADPGALNYAGSSGAAECTQIQQSSTRGLGWVYGLIIELSAVSLSLVTQQSSVPRQEMRLYEQLTFVMASSKKLSITVCIMADTLRSLQTIKPLRSVGCRQLFWCLALTGKIVSGLGLDWRICLAPNNGALDH